MWRECQTDDGEVAFLRADRLWVHMSTIKNEVTGQPQFGMLAKVAQLVLCLPHSNADAERVFSAIGLNKTDTRNALSLDGTLSSIMTIKMATEEPCFRYEPSAEIIQSSRSATYRCNTKQ